MSNILGVNDWKPFQIVNFSDEKILQYHIDTRDFHCTTNVDAEIIKFDLSKIDKTPERFYHTPEEVMEVITRLYDESGGENEWRYIHFEGEGNRISENWAMKYIRVYRLEKGLLVCTKDSRAINKDVLKCKINQEHLSAHSFNKIRKS